MLIILSYLESVDLLYSCNTFDSRRTDAVLRLPSVMLPHRMQQLRRLQFSTAFSCLKPRGPQWELPPGRPADFWCLPDDRRQWAATCEILASLQHLEYARFTIILQCQNNRHGHPETEARLLCELLRPLKAVRCSQFIVKVARSMEILQEELGATPFRLRLCETPVC